MLAVLFEGQRTSAVTLCAGGGGLDGGGGDGLGVDVVVVISGAKVDSRNAGIIMSRRPLWS